MFDAGDLVVVDFPGVTGVKRRPAVVLSSAVYHATRPDVIVGLITSQAVALGPTDYALHDWMEAGLRVPSVRIQELSHYPPALRTPDPRRPTVRSRLVGGSGSHSYCASCTVPA